MQAAALNSVMHGRTDEDRIRLTLLDNHGLFRAALARLLASENGFEVVGECGSSAEALKILNGSPVDVVLLGFDLEPEQAVGFISAARRGGYQGRFLIVADAVDAELSATALKLGASGIFLKSEVPERLIQAIRVIASGAVWVDQTVIQLLADHCLNQPRATDRKSSGALETREQGVLLEILGGLTNRKIADDLGISESSVKNILQSLFRKAGVRTRSQLVKLALEGSLGDVRQLSKRQDKALRDEAAEPESSESHDAARPARSQSLG